jgi:hypothetical protein
MAQPPEPEWMAQQPEPEPEWMAQQPEPMAQQEPQREREAVPCRVPARR